MTFSKISEVCKCCEHRNDCNNKRMELCAIAVSKKETLAQPCNQSLTNPLIEDICVKHDYRDIKIAENTTVTIDIEELKENIKKDIYKKLYCDFWRAENA